MSILRSAWGIPVGLPATTWMVELGTRLMRTESELALKSRRVVPARLLESGFTFEFPDWNSAARDLCQRWRRAHSAAA
jgi:NAD dependent epimerase/dehydratase family enzyme